MKTWMKMWLAALTAAAVIGFANTAEAEEDMLSGFTRGAVLRDLRSIRADHWELTGGNLTVRGNVFIPAGDYEIRADEAVVNAETHDFDARGNLELVLNRDLFLTVTPDRLEEIERLAGVSVEIRGVTTDVFGQQQIAIKARRTKGRIRAAVLSGNLDTGVFQFGEAELQIFNLVCRVASGYRQANGIIHLNDAEMSTCGYLASENAHYSLSCAKAEIRPYDTGTFGRDDIETDYNQYSVLATNCKLHFYGVPVLWLPYFYKPKDETLSLFQIQTGRTGDFGFFLSLSKRYQLIDYPDTSARIYVDWYEKRGFGYGVDAEVNLEQSRTRLFAYGIYDKHRYESTDPRKYGIKIPYQRFIFQLNHLTHITPTLDFRGSFNWQSDEFFTKDFFGGFYSGDPQPATFASLEKQFEHFTASLYVRPQVNQFFPTVESLPTFRIDVQRQELGSTNLYYQGEHSIGYYQRKWRDYSDRHHWESPYAYSSGRFDSVNFLYYPVKFDFINIIPRAGMRLTAYTDSSKTKIDEEDLTLLLLHDAERYTRRMWTKDYDGRGGSRFRFIGEFGVEANTHIYGTWQDVRNYWLQLDGLRHVIIPYVNYTYIPEPTEDREHLYYFDDVDRIDTQHFIRFGIINRLQTRRGNVIANYLTMENYWDFHMRCKNGYNNVGDFCTKLTAEPLKGLKISTFFSIDPSGNDDISGVSDEIYRRGRNVGHPGLYLDWLNRWNVTLSYEPIEDVVFQLRYNYKNIYRTRSAYSMGSSLLDLESGSAFDKYNLTQTQTISLGVRAPLTPDRRTFGAYSMTYDFNAGFVTNHTFAVVRQLHCWEVAAEVQLDTKYDDGEKDTDVSFYITAYLTGLTGPLQRQQQSLIGASRRMQDF